MFDNFNWEKIAGIGFDIAKVATIGTPVGLALNVLDAVVSKDNVGSGVDDEAVVALLEKVAGSTQNKVDDKLLCMVKAYLQCECND